MKTSLLLCSALALAVAGGCARHDDAADQSAPQPVTAAAEPTPSTTNPPAPATDAMTPAADSASNDSVALGLLAAVNEHEIAAAKQAEGKQVSGPVLDYAKMMQKEHGANLEKTRSLGTLADTAEIKAMKEKGDSDLQTLGQKSGKEYEAAYVDAMIKGHTQVLGLIDGRLLSLASNGPVKDHLTETRGHVAMHLEAAQKLQASMK